MTAPSVQLDLPFDAYAGVNPDEDELPNLPPEDKVPNIDDGPAEVSYPDWNEANSFVVSGPLDKAEFPGQRFPTVASARRYVQQKYKKVYEFGNVPGRWFARVPRPLLDV